MSHDEPISVADAEEPWPDPGFESGLIDRCRQGWNTPVARLTTELLATYLRQRIALSLIIPEAQRRVTNGFTDGTELFDDELAEALKVTTHGP